MKPLRQPLGLLQAAALATFESHHGKAIHVPQGPRRDRLAHELDADSGDLIVQSDASYMEPVVALIRVDGECVEDAASWWLP